MPSLRIGEGWDIHQLVPGRPLVLGGVTVPHSHGLLGHSDADALLHAITDALFGAAGWAIVNIDSTIVAQAPKLAPHIPAMRERIAQVLGIVPGAVNVKAKTAETLGPVGQGQAIEARAVCLLTALPPEV